MVRLFTITLLVTFSAGLTCCQKGTDPDMPDTPLFDSIPTIYPVVPIINEVSGIADSKKNNGHLWAMEDGGNPTQLFLLNHNGAVQKKIFIKGIGNRDWEEMAINGDDIYLGDIGDNNSLYSDYAFYKFSEPLSSVDTIRSVETYRFTYVDGPHDAEAFFVEPSTGDIYIITKRDAPSRIYKLAAPLSASTNNSAVFMGTLNYSGVTAAAISTDGKEIIVKTYFEVGYYKKGNGETIAATLQKTPLILPYQSEPQGEAICFSTTNNGYFTLSEKAFGTNVQLYFYKRK